MLAGYIYCTEDHAQVLGFDVTSYLAVNPA